MSFLLPTLEVLGQLRSFVRDVSDEDYVHPVVVLDGGTLGQHVRHAVTFYMYLLLALEQEDAVVRYHVRFRDPLMERQREVALGALDRVIRTLPDFDQDCVMGFLSEPTDEAPALSISSSLYREYAYVMDHTIHHMALLRIGIKELCPGMQLPPSFGIARSTISYRAQSTLLANKV